MAFWEKLALSGCASWCRAVAEIGLFRITRYLGFRYFRYVEIIGSRCWVPGAEISPKADILIFGYFLYLEIPLFQNTVRYSLKISTI